MKKFEPGETEFKKRVLTYLKTHFPDGWWYKSNDRFTAGIPDILGSYQGSLIAFELKVGTNKPTPIQVKVLQQILEAGGVARWFSNRDDWKQVINDAIKEVIE